MYPPDSEIVKAILQLTAEAKAMEQGKVKAEIADYCRENLAPYKNPKLIEIVNALPLTGVGKVDKKALKKRAV